MNQAAREPGAVQPAAQSGVCRHHADRVARLVRVQRAADPLPAAAHRWPDATSCLTPTASRPTMRRGFSRARGTRTSRRTCHQSVPSATNSGKANDLLGNWDQSRAVKSGEEYQTCHMPQQVGESANGEKKRTIANHSFPGRVGKLRQDAAKLDVQTRIDGDKTTIVVKVQSLVPHNLPATHPAWAAVVLNLDIKGKNLKTVFTDKRVYGRTYLDAQGQPTIFDFEAAKVAEDTVLKPEETREESIHVSDTQRYQDVRCRSWTQLRSIERPCLVPPARRS